MAAKRMFSKSITNSSRFLMMPQSSQNLYFHLGMNADDDGFCEHFAIMRMTESKPDDLRILQSKQFVKIFDDQVLIITDWKENNLIRSDRYTASKYLEIYKTELKLISDGIPLDIPLVDSGKVRLGKVSIGKDSKEIRHIIPPDYSMVSEYISTNCYDITPNEFIDCYEARGWMVGKSKMKDWQASLRTFVSNKIKWDAEKKGNKLVKTTNQTAAEEMRKRLSGVI